jgi:hypothetical protein
MRAGHVPFPCGCAGPPASLSSSVGLRLGSMRKRTFIVALLVVVVGGIALVAQTPKHSVKPKNGFVPDAKTATKIAVAVWEPIYGEAQIASERPYRARLDTNNVWTVEGSLPKGFWGGAVKGGVALAEIAKTDGRILRVSHGK